MTSLSRYIIALLTAFAFALTSCLDDRLYDPDDLEIGEGFCDLPITVSFRDLEPALSSRSAGNAVDKVEKLWVVIYSVVDGQPTFYRKILANEVPGYKCDQTGNSAEPDDV